MTKRKKLLAALASFVVIMFFFSYALVPLYNVMCRAFGINGKTDNAPVAQATRIDKSRLIKVQFLSNTNANLAWTFYPLTKSIEIHPGESVTLAYFARNDTDHAMTVQAIPSVSPGVAAAYLKKTQCFCFNQQTLRAHQFMKMPLIFHLDVKIPRNIHELTLSYTLFDYKKSSRKQGRIS